MAVLDYDRALLSVVHLLRCPELLQAYAEPVDQAGLFKPYQDLQFIWDTLSAYWKRYSKSPPKHLVFFDLEHRLADGITVKPVPDVLQTVSSAYSLPAESLTEAFAADTLREALSVVLKKELQTRLDCEGSESIPEILAHAGRRYISALSVKPRFVKPMKDLAGNLGDAAKTPIGVPWLDGLLGGGVSPGDMLGFIMPSGCGKTTLCLQIARALVRSLRRIDVAAYEQAAKGDITLRTCILMSEGCRTEWQGLAAALHAAQTQEEEQSLPAGTLTDKVLANVRAYVSPLVYQRFLDNMAGWTKYFTWVDYTRPEVKIPTIDALFSYVDDLTAETGVQPYALGIDWWGLLRNRMLSMQSNRSEQMNRMFCGEQLSALKRRLQERGMVGFVFHQLAGSEGRKGHKHMPTAYASSEDSSFLHAFDACFVAGTQNPQHQIRMIGDKLRKAGVDSVMIQIDGEHCILDQVVGLASGVKNVPLMDGGEQESLQDPGIQTGYEFYSER